MVSESFSRRSPLGGLATELAQTCASPDFGCREDAFRVLTEIRCAPAATAEAAALVGCTLPAVGAEAVVDESYVVGLGPGWWLVDAPDGALPPMGTASVSAVEVSAQRTPLILRGPGVREVLAHGTSLDLHPAHFAVGSAAQTLLAKAGVVLARTDSDDYRVWVRASFARYLATWLMDASLEHR